MFTLIENYDVQETRRIAKEECWNEAWNKAQNEVRNEDRYSVAKDMLADDEPIEKIIRYSKLTREQIESLKGGK